MKLINFGVRKLNSLVIDENVNGDFSVVGILRFFLNINLNFSLLRFVFIELNFSVNFLFS